MASKLDSDCVESSIEAVDRMLLNAYGSVYKIAAKCIVYKEINHWWSETEELLTAKNILANLWSCLEYCCNILYTKKKGRPNPQTARKIFIPCNFPGQPTKQPLIADFSIMFSELQFTDEERVNEDIRTFYLLHHFRNTLAHRTIAITGNRGSEMPKMLMEKLKEVPEVAVSIYVPNSPWKNESCNKDCFPDGAHDYKCIPLLDLLYDSCRLVQRKRDQILQHADKKNFRSFDFKFSIDDRFLTVSSSGVPRHIRIKRLHLKCYGLEREYEYILKKKYP